MVPARIFGYGIGLSAIIMLGSVAAAPRLKEPRESKLEGTWRQIHAEFDGDDLTEANRAWRNHWVITNDTVSIYTVGGEHRGQWTYRVDPAKRPAEIDLTCDDSGKKVTFPCIYTLEDGKLTVCLQNFPERGRPKALETKPNSGIEKYVYLRAMPGDEKSPGNVSKDK